MKVNLPTGKDVAEMLLLCAPPDVLTGLELARETTNEFASYFDSQIEYHKASMTALALWYCNRSGADYFKSQNITRELYFSPEVIHQLVSLTAIESYTETDKLKDEILKQKKSKDGRDAVNVKHNSPGGPREKGEAIRSIWASGKYSSRDICAEEEYAGLNWNYSSARKALRNTPNPT